MNETINDTTALLYSQQIHAAVTRHIGEEIYEIRFVNSYIRTPGTTYKNRVYIVNSKWEVTVICNCFSNGVFYDSYTIKEYSAVLEARKAFGRRAKYRSRISSVPWEIAMMLNHISYDPDAFNALSAIKTAKETLSGEHRHELGTTYVRKTSAIKEAIGNDAWKALNCTQDFQIDILTTYLLGNKN